MTQLEYDPTKIYLALKEIEGSHVLVDQHGRRLAWVRELQPNLPYDDVATCKVEFIWSNPGSVHPEKYVNRPPKN